MGETLQRALMCIVGVGCGHVMVLVNPGRGFELPATIALQPACGAGTILLPECCLSGNLAQAEGEGRPLTSNNTIDTAVRA